MKKKKLKQKIKELKQEVEKLTKAIIDNDQDTFGIIRLCESLKRDLESNLWKGCHQSNETLKPELVYKCREDLNLFIPSEQTFRFEVEGKVYVINKEDDGYYFKDETCTYLIRSDAINYLADLENRMINAMK